MPQLKICLLGQFQVQLDETVITSFVSDKARALLAYLAVEGSNPQRRETLATLLWPDKSETRARGNLRCTLTNVRKVIGDNQVQTQFLLVTRHDIKIHKKSNAWVDVDKLSQIHQIETPSVEDFYLFKDILDIYQGEFLTGFNLSDSLAFDEWALLKREAYARMMDAILQRASDYYEQREDYISALPFAWRHVSLEPWQERARRQLMRLLVNTGRRDEALQQYLDLENTLKTALKIEPSKQTRQLYKSIQMGRPIHLPDRFSKPDSEELPAQPDFLLTQKTQMETPKEMFFGRQEELNKLNSHLDSIKAGQGSIVMISGEAGSGKTNLVKEFVQQAQSRYPDLVAVTGQNNAFTGMGDPYLPFREILYQLSGDIEGRWRAGAVTRQIVLNLWQAIPYTCHTLLNYGPDLIDTLLPSKTLLALTNAFASYKPTWYRELEEKLNETQDHPRGAVQQGNLISQYIQVLQKISNKVPLLLFLDDLQWADAGTIGMLFQFVQQIKPSRIFLVGAYRSEEVSLLHDDKGHPLIPVLHEVKRQFGAAFINLDATSGRDFIDSLIDSEPNNLQESFHEQLYQLTGGNALFTIETLRCMQESGVLIKDEHGVWILRSGFHLDSLPPRTEGIIAQRISRLPQKLQYILTLASIEGEDFTAEIIAAVGEMQMDHIVTLLSDQLGKQHRLVKPQQVKQRGGQTISTYRFRHFLFQNYLYLRLDDIQRNRLHGKVGCELERLAGDNKTEVAVQLARHFHLANQVEKASIYYTLAGERAICLSAYPEAVKHFEAALNNLLLMSVTPERNEKELDLQLNLGRAYQATVGYAHEKVGLSYQRALELCQSTQDALKCITTLQLLCSYYANIANFKTAEKLLSLLEKNIEQLEEILPEYGPQPHLGHAYLDSLFGRHQSVIDHTTEGIKYYDQATQHTSGDRVGVELGLFCHGWAGLHSNWLGYPEKAKFHIQALQKIAESYHSKLFTRDALWFSAWISLELEDWDAAREYTEEFLALTIKEGYFFYESAARGFIGKIRSKEGKHKQAIESIQNGLAMFYQTGAVASQTIWLHDLAIAYCAAGQVGKGFATIEKAEKVENETGEARYKSTIQRIKGDLYRLKGDETAAEDAYHRAIDIAKTDGTKLLELEAVKRLVKLWEVQGKADQGYILLQEVYNWFTEGFDTPMLIEAKQLLEKYTS